MMKRSASLSIICLVASACIPRYQDYQDRQEDVVVQDEEPEILNNKVSQREWDLCCRICMKENNLKAIVYILDRDVMQCQCMDGIRAEIFPPEK